MYTINELFDLAHTQAGAYLSQFCYPWEALEGLEDFICRFGERLCAEEYQEVSPKVWVHRTAKIAPTAYLGAPCIVGAGTEVRHCAFIRGNVLIGENCVVGNSTELKNSILFDGVQAPHYNYVGDSILGFKAHLGAGAITSNVKADKTPIAVAFDGEKLSTGRKKVGAMVGDFAEIGCNSVLNPGCIVGKNSIIYPLSCVRGTVKEQSIYKKDGVTVRKNDK